jgi:Tol biopolymer transport system component
MELVEGEGLDEVIARGPVPVDEAIPIAIQIAEALETAHEAGVVHRDLKPANVKIRPDGTVKVLDFGLAKAWEEGEANDLSLSPTLTRHATAAGVILGTAAYMAPEQARGKSVDRRADIWAFGVVLWEMLTGRQLFGGETVSDVLAAVLMREVELSTLPPGFPLELRRLLRRCLNRAPRERLQSIGDARVVLGEVLADPAASEPHPAAAPPVSRQPALRLAPWLVVATLVGAGVAWIAIGRTPPAAPERVLRVAIPPPPEASFGDLFALSPDGSRLAFVAIDHESGAPSLWLRALDQRDAVRLAPSENDGGRPFWSPDGRSLAFFADGKLKRIDPDGGPPQVLCDAPTPRGGSWGPDDTIVFSGSFRTGLEIVSAAGGAPRVLTTLDAERGEKSHRWPVHLPDGTHLVFLAQTAEGGTKDDTSGVELLNLATGDRRPLVTANSSPMFASQGYLLFWRSGSLLAQGFDPRRLELSGAARAIAGPVVYTVNEMADASISQRGDLLFKEGTAGGRTSLDWTDRSGRQLSQILAPSVIEGGFALSHDGTRLAVGLTRQGSPSCDLWIYDLERGSVSRLTFEEGDEVDPVWSSDDRRILYVSTLTNDGNLYARNADGSGGVETVLVTAEGVVHPDWSHDGRWLVVQKTNGQTGQDLERYDLSTKQLTPLVQTPFNDTLGRISPDDRWLAFVSEQSGRPEIFVQSTLGQSGLWQVSNSGGTWPAWSHDGREIYYVQPPDRLMAVEIEVEAGATIRSSTPRQLFRVPADGFDVSPDGERFVVNLRASEASDAALTLITNWTQLAPRP